MAQYGSSRRKQIREPPSVPFLWEDRPGVAKKDWRPMVSSVTTFPALPSPVKLIASVPFVWEEKPGTPLSCFSMESPPILGNLVSLPSPPMYSHQWYNEDKFNTEQGGPEGENYGLESSIIIPPEKFVSFLYSPSMDSLWHNQDGVFNLDLQSFSFETDDSFNSAHSLSANCLVSTSAISEAVPVLETSGTVNLETPLSPSSETDSTTSSYATGISNLAGSSFLECLFPLYAPNSSFPRDVSCPGESYFLSPPEQKSHNSNLENDDDGEFDPRRPATLGELIMMSRRKSCQRKAVQMAKRNLSMDFMNRKAFRCCIFGTGINFLEGLKTKRNHLLKLV